MFPIKGSHRDTNRNIHLFLLNISRCIDIYSETMALPSPRCMPKSLHLVSPAWFPLPLLVVPNILRTSSSVILPLPKQDQSSSGGPWVGRSLNLFLHSTRSLENLSSGENLAGCALCVGEPSGAVFCTTYATFVILMSPQWPHATLSKA